MNYPEILTCQTKTLLLTLTKQWPLPPVNPLQPNHKPVELSSLPTPQLSNLKNQLTQDLQHLTSSFQQLRAAQAKFRECIQSVREGVERGEEGAYYTFHYGEGEGWIWGC